MNLRAAAAVAVAMSTAFAAGCTTAVGGAIRAFDDEPNLVTINQEAQLAYEGGETAKAEALYRSLARRMPNDAETWLRLGNLYARSNRPDEAASAYQRALMADNSEARAWHNLGVVRLRQAWASLLQAQATVKPKDGLAPQVDSLLEYLGKLPQIEAEPRKAVPAADASKY
jgi:tetratricopeptide (TPR) repeat protein